VTPHVARAHPETLSAPTVERRFPVMDCFVEIVERGARRTILLEGRALQIAYQDRCVTLTVAILVIPLGGPSDSQGAWTQIPRMGNSALRR